ncbi:hypothetical protein EV385_2713 [Krasilnikovia cinnamomea]|uniref:Uncharacterized protein n=1 Tax=Krasilnikovia cinnamomea TaxID=349313 RepID=A0A4Q7ZK87_9ACTN|nr:hypothetical protein [Krasilnikovia cinnamomea]RZU50921.1 hypothetical protein EV385_2713 [Krasilnikovia cinnamomea]
MFATIKSLIPEPRQADQQPRAYVGRHRQPEKFTARAQVTVVPGPVGRDPDPAGPAAEEPDDAPADAA